MAEHHSKESFDSRGATTKRAFWLAVAVLLLLTFLMFADVLCSSTRVLSNVRCDLSFQFLAWRDFGFRELGHGNLALWNPHVYAGEPFLGGFQTALLYPPNWLYLVLPLGPATNWQIALHVFLGGLFMYLWTSRRGLHPAACLMAAAVLMFCGPSFLQVFAGHLAHFNTMTWVPLLLLAIDEFFQSQRWGWCLAGMFALAMEIFAGYPGYVFCTVVAAGIYVCWCLPGARRRWLVLAGVAGMFLGAAALAAVQLLPGWDASRESVRGAGLPYAEAASLSFPPENSITALAPGFFGDIEHTSYWGRWYLWEVCLFISVTGLVLAVYGGTCGQRRLRRFGAPMVLLLLLLALGDYTPLFHFLYYHVPGFSSFRTPSRFLFFAAVFLTMLSGVGLDRLLRQPCHERRLAAIVAGLALLLGLAAATVHFAVSSGEAAAWWQKLVDGMGASGQSFLPRELYAGPDHVRRFGECAALSLLIAAGTLSVLAGLLAALRPYRWTAYLIGLLAVIEVFAFAATSRDTFELAAARTAGLAEFLAAHPGDYRILNMGWPNEAMMVGAYDIWGAYDPLVPRRYAELMAYTQGKTEASPYVVLNRSHRFFDILRLRYIVPRGINEGAPLVQWSSGLPHLQLVQDYRVIKGRDAIFAAMNDPAFDPRKTVVLEDAPDVEPDRSAAPGTARLVEASTDYLVIEARLSAPAILLVTDGWSKDWRAEAADGDARRHYRVMPADYVLRAIPLPAGEHRIRMEYRPASFVVGKWTSLAAWLVFAIAVGVYLARNRALAGRTSRETTHASTA